MSPRTFQLLAVVAALVCLAGGFAGGWFLRGPGNSSSSSSGTPQAPSSTLTLVGARSLNAVTPTAAERLRLERGREVCAYLKATALHREGAEPAEPRP
jgi:hypothetical protein